MTPVRHVIYLHGFASSPASSKARRFARELAARGVTFACPDLNEPAFETLTVTRMLDQLRRAIAEAPAGPIALIGSSLGAFVAIVSASRGTGRDLWKTQKRGVEEFSTDRAPSPDRLILLAPAVGFGGNRLTQFGEHSVEDWRRAGRVPVFHHAHERTEDIGFSLYEDAARYDAFAVPSTVPTLVFHGRFDDTVPPASVERWAKNGPLVDLRMVDDGHQLAASMDLIWEESRGFLGLARA